MSKKQGTKRMPSALSRAIAWLLSPKSDIALFLAAILLANLVSSRAFLRLDLTENNAYSLSRASVEAVASLEDPLSVKVFFSEKLPAPYNSVERYLRDILVEYKGAANRNFDYEFFDMTKTENEEIARSYGLSMVQIQELKDNEVGIKNAWMGLAIVHGDLIETIPEIVNAEGLEYRLTTTVSRMLASRSVLSGLSGKVSMTVYVSPALGQFGIAGFNQIEKRSFEAWKAVNGKNLDRIDYRTADPAKTGVDELARRYGLQKVSWAEKGDPAKEGSGLVGVVLEYGERFAVLPVELARTLFGGYAVTGLESLEKGLEEGLRSLIANSLSVGYVTGHGEQSLADERAGAGRFASLAKDSYEFREFNPDAEDVPSGLASVIINGPKSPFTEEGLFRLDQYLMRGGNLLVFIDPFEEIQPDPQMGGYGGESQFIPIDSGLTRLLTKYGVSVGKDYVLDKTCYEAQQRGMGKVPLYYVPIVGKKGLDQTNPISRNLANVIFLQNASLEAVSVPDGVRATTLARSSAESWTMSGRISLSPWAMTPPSDASALKSLPLALLLEGTFPSAFTATPAKLAQGTDVTSKDVASTTAAVAPSEKRLASGVLAGKLVVIGSSKITTAQVIDEAGAQPIAVFARNALDYVSGREDLAEMRSKGLSLSPLEAVSAGKRAAARAVNLYGLPALVALAGLVAWRRRVARRRAIKRAYEHQGGTR